MNSTKRLPLQQQRPPYDPAKGDRVSATWPHAMMIAREIAAEKKCRVIVTQGHDHGYVDLGGPWWRVQPR